jgi:hypothetical protein
MERMTSMAMAMTVLLMTVLASGCGYRTVPTPTGDLGLSVADGTGAADGGGSQPADGQMLGSKRCWSTIGGESQCVCIFNGVETPCPYKEESYKGLSPAKTHDMRPPQGDQPVWPDNGMLPKVTLPQHQDMIVWPSSNG